MEKLQQKEIFWRYIAQSDWTIISMFTGKKLYWSVDASWYHRVSIVIWDSWKQRNLSLHRLIAYAFLWLDIDDTKTFVCHKNDIRDDNRLDNLFLWSNKDNVRDMIKKWRMVFFGKTATWVNYNNWEKIWTSKLTEEQVIEIKQRLISWEQWDKIAIDMNVRPATISAIKSGKSWKHIHVEGEDGIKKFNNVNVDKVIELHKEWKKNVEIAKILWCNNEWVWDLLKKYVTGYCWKKKLWKDDVLEIKKLLIEWKWVNEIAKIFWVCHSSIWRIKQWKVHRNITWFQKLSSKKGICRIENHPRYWNHNLVKNIDRNKVKKLYEEWYIANEISKMLWISAGHTSYILYKMVKDYKPKWSRKLDFKQVREIKWLIKEWLFHKDIAEKYNVSLRTIRWISCGQFFADII